MTAIGEQDEAERDAAFAAIGLETEVAEWRIRILWRGIQASYGAPHFTDVPLPGLTEPIQVRMVARDHGQVKIGGRAHDVVPSERGRSIKIPDDDRA